MSEQRRRSEWPPPFGRLDRMFEEWFRTLPMRRPEWPGQEEDLIRVDEYRDDDTLVVRAELPGIDPDRDVEITAGDGMLRISAERRAEERSADRQYSRRELRYGTLTRSLPIPDGARESDIEASYKDGILEVRIPVAEPPPSEPTRINVSRG
ncbi:Hsp20/alpha crystallin family protein [Geodermatophilus sp. URMC 64]